MFDDTPAPLGDVTRRWTLLDDEERDRQVDRLLGRSCTDHHVAHVDTPTRDGGACYQRLVPAAIAGDPEAVGWLATTHRPLLVSRGRVLLEHDPSEWGAVCLEVLHTTIAKADLSDPSWLRRRVARQVTHRLGKVIGAYLECRSHERPVGPARLHASQEHAPAQAWAPHAELGHDLDRLLGRFDTATQEALFALADHEPLYEVADRHGLSYTAVRQRVSRARKALQPQLAAYRRAVC